MSTIDQQFVEFIVKTLVSNPEKVAINRVIDEKDVGRVIGRRGATAQSIRTLLRALGTKNDARYNLKIVNTDELDGEGEPTAARIVADYNEETEEENDGLAEKTRAELADLDDLEV